MPVLDFITFNLQRNNGVTRALIITGTVNKPPGYCSHFPKAIDSQCFLRFLNKTSYLETQRNSLGSSAQYLVFSNTPRGLLVCKL